MNKEKKINDKSKSTSGRGNFKSRGVGCCGVGKKRHIQRERELKKDGEGKSK